MPIGIHQSSRGSKSSFSPNSIAGMLYYWLSEDQTAVSGTTANGTGSGTLTVSSGVITTSTVAAGTYGTWLNGNARANCFITITGQPSLANNGTFKLTTGGADDGSSVAWTNAAGVTEAFVGTYCIWGSVNTVTERLAGKVFNRTGVGDAIPGDCYFRFSPLGLTTNKRALLVTKASATGDNMRVTLDDLTLASNLNSSANFTMGGYYYCVNGWTSNTTNIGFQHVTATQAATNIVSPGNRITILQAADGTTLTLNGGGQTDTMTSTTVPAPSRGFQLFVWTYDYGTRTTDFYVDGILIQSVQDVVGTAPVPASLRYFHIGDAIQSTTVRGDIYCGGTFMSLGKMSFSDQLAMKTFYDQALKPTYPDIANDPIMGVNDLLTYVNADDAVTLLGGGIETITDRVSLNNIYETPVTTLPIVELTQFPGHKVLTCNSSAQVKCFYTTLAAQLVGTDVPVTFFVYHKPTAFSSGNLICFENGASSPRTGMTGGTTNANGFLLTRLGSPTANAQVNFSKTLNVWQSWCVTFDGVTATFYLNKVSQGTATPGTSLASTMTEVAVASNGFSGHSGDYYAWIAIKRAITQTEVNLIHDSLVNMLAT